MYAYLVSTRKCVGDRVRLPTVLQMSCCNVHCFGDGEGVVGREARSQPHCQGNIVLKDEQVQDSHVCKRGVLGASVIGLRMS